MPKMTTGQIRELIEIDSKSATGIRAEVQELIRKLTAGKPEVNYDNSREGHAKRLFDKGFGGKLTFEEYLALIPEIPAELKADDPRFPLLVLVDASLVIRRRCRNLGILIGQQLHSNSFVDRDPDWGNTTKIYWIRAQNGQNEHGLLSRTSFAEDEVGLTVHEGISLFAQQQALLKGQVIRCLATVSWALSDRSAVIATANRPQLGWCKDTVGGDLSGTASRKK